MKCANLKGATSFGRGSDEVTVTQHKIYIGTAGWTLPARAKNRFVGEGSHLERYSRLLNAAEINSSFYREHSAETYRKWADMVPSDFRFSVKLNRYFTHDQRLGETGKKLKQSLEPMMGLEEKFGTLLIQLPPSLEFSRSLADHFFTELRHFYDGEVVLEPRHKSWASRESADLLTGFSINKVLADPEPCRMPKSLRRQVEFITYFRLHGTPEMYKSSYSPQMIDRIAQQISKTYMLGGTVWCVFDNTSFGHATENALDLSFMLENGLAFVPRETLLLHAPH